MKCDNVKEEGSRLYNNHYYCSLTGKLCVAHFESISFYNGENHTEYQVETAMRCPLFTYQGKSGNNLESWLSNLYFSKKTLVSKLQEAKNEN